MHVATHVEQSPADRCVSMWIYVLTYQDCNKFLKCEILWNVALSDYILGRYDILTMILLLGYEGVPSVHCEYHWLIKKLL